MTERIFSQRFPAAANSTARPCGVYLLHGTGEHLGRYKELIKRLTDAGWPVGAHDHPGHGQSSGQRGSLLPLGCLQVQAAVQIERFAQETGAPPILFGHSLGGVLAAELVLSHHIPSAGLILSAPAFRARISWKNRLKVNLMHALAPDKTVELPYAPENLTRDSDKIAESLSDPLIHGFKSARFIQWLLDSGAESIALAHSLPIDTLVLIAGADPVVDPAATREWVKRAPGNRIAVHEYPASFHEILNEVVQVREQALSDILMWLDRHS